MNKYFAFDRGILHPQFCENMEIRINPAVKDTENSPMLLEGGSRENPCPWEVRIDNGYPNVIRDEKAGLYRLYYTTFLGDAVSEQTDRSRRKGETYVPMNTRITGLAYAESRDGVHWIRPTLGLCEVRGRRDNNVLMVYAHGAGILLDEQDPDPKRRFKMVAMKDIPGQPSHMAVSFSEDGIHFGELVPWPETDAKGDTHNFPFIDQKDGKYKVITRNWRNGLRLSCISESEDFIHWSAPKEILRGCGFDSQVYSMPVFQDNGIYIGLASMFHEGDRSAENFDTVTTELTYATKPEVFDFAAPGQELIPLGKGSYPDGEYDCGCIYTTAPLEIDGKLCFYYMGSNGKHTGFRETAFGRAFLEKDAYAYWAAKDPGRKAVVTVSRLTFDGDLLELKCSIPEGAQIRAAFSLDPLTKQWLDGYGFDDCRLTPGEDGWMRLQFAHPLKSLDPAKPVFLILELYGECRIYGLRGSFKTVTPVY